MALVRPPLPRNSLFIPSSTQTVEAEVPNRKTRIKTNSRFPTFVSVRASMSSANPPSQPASSRFMEFPHASPPVKDLMVDLVSTVENRLDSQLLPCSLPPDVRYYQNQTGSSQASLHIRSGIPASPIDFILGSWLRCKLPTGAALNITSLSCYLNESTDAPHFLLELIQSSATSLVFVLDLVPRKDLVLYPDYLKAFYEDVTPLENQRQLLYAMPEVQPYFSNSLYIRSVVSPTAILVRVQTEQVGGESRMEEILKERVGAVAKQVLDIWLESCACAGKREIGESERRWLKKRDGVYKSRTIEIDLGTNLPRMFGQETADRVLGVMRTIFNA